MYAILFLVGSLAALVAIVGLIRPLPKIGLRKRWMSALVLFFAFSACVAGAAMTPPETPEQIAERKLLEEKRVADAEEIRAADEAARAEAKRPKIQSLRSVETVATSGDDLVVHAHIENAWDDKGFVDAASVSITSIMKSIQKNAVEVNPGAKRLSYRVTVSGTDRLGNDTRVGLFNLVFPMEDIRSANLDNLSLARTMNLATMVNVTSPAGRQAVAKWCLAGGNLQDAQQFCAAGVGAL